MDFPYVSWSLCVEYKGAGGPFVWDPSHAAVEYNLGTPLIESYISPSHAAVGYKL